MFIIYSTKSEYDFSLEFIAANSPSATAASYVEVLGYRIVTSGDVVVMDDLPGPKVAGNHF